MRADELKSISTADVYKAEQLAGTITRTKLGCKFEYNSNYLQEVSTTGIAFNMRKSSSPYSIDGVNLPPFFAGLLPEGLRLTALVKQIKTSTDDLLSLLMAVGADCIGDVIAVPTGERNSSSLTWVEGEQLEKVDFYELFRKSIGLSNSNDELRHEPAVPGVQEKISVRRISLPVHGSKKGKAYILKLNPPEKPLLVENEYFFLSAAKACRIETNAASLIKDKNGNSGLLVERFDRIVQSKASDSPVLKVHQEDACQFLERYPADKYRISCLEIAAGIQKFAGAPVVENSKFMQLLAFSYITGNGDLHGKNISLRVNVVTDRIELTPAYDLLCTLPYGDRKMALKFEGKDESLNRKMFVTFGERFGIRAPATTAMLDELCKGMEPWIEQVKDIGFDQRRTADIQRVMRDRIQELRS